MLSNNLGADEELERLEALRGFCVLDTPPEDRFDRITGLVADLFDTPIALVSIVDKDRQWFKSRQGIDGAETPRNEAFCAHVLPMGREAVLVVEDASLDPRFAANPLVTGEMHIRFYMGAALTTKDGYNLGTLCAIDTRPRAHPSDREIERLKTLARIVMDELELGIVQREVSERQRLLELAEATSGVGHWRYDLRDGRISWSDEVYRIHGVERASYDPNYGAAVDFYHADDQATVTRLVEKAVATGEGYDFQLRMHRADGALRHVVCRATTEADRQGRTTAIFGVFQDVTDHVLALDAATQSEARYRLLTENANDVVTQINPAGVFTYVSPAVMAMADYTPEEVIGRSSLDFIHPDDRAVTRERFQTAMVEGGGWRIEYRICRKDGEAVWVEARPTAVLDPATGRLVCVTDVLRDITTRKILEAEREAARAEAEAATAVKSEFLANMSHELRTPLTSILGYSELLRPHVVADEKASYYHERTIAASKALLSIVSDVLDFSKLEAGQVEVSLRPLNPAELFASVTEMMAPQAAAKGLALTFEASTDLPAQAWIDDARVRQILLNFTSNAVKFTKTGSVAVALARTGDMLRCEVRDTGQGVPKDRMDRLFQRFSQVDASTTRTHGGTGLGLAICKGLAEAMGGRVGVISTPGKGSTFWFELPFKAAENDVFARDAQDAHDDCDGLPLLDGLRLLVVDDNPMNRELVRLLMAAVDAEVSEASSGEEAIRLANAAPFDAILMDVRMPGISGPDAARAIRSGGGCNDGTPIIAFTADADNAAAAVGWAGAFDGMVAKPIVAANLYAVLNDLAPGGGVELMKGAARV